MSYTSFNNHTNYSLGMATIKPSELFSKAKSLGQNSVAITDYASLAGMWDALKASKKTGVKLIPGCTFNFVDSVEEKEFIKLRNIVIVARNAQGYKNLLRLSKAGFDNFIEAFKKAIPRIDWGLLEQYKEGLICFVGSPNGIVSNEIMDNNLDKAKEIIIRLKSIFGEYFALELQPHNMQRRKSNYSHAVSQQKINLALKKLGEELNVKCIVSSNIHYEEQDHADDQDVLICIQSRQPKKSGNRIYFDKKEFYVKSEDNIKAFFERHKKIWGEEFIESLFANTKYFDDLCGDASYVDPAVATGFKNQLPEFTIQDEPDYKDFLEWKKNNLVDDIADDALFYRYKSYKGLEEKIKEGKIPEEDRQWCLDQMLEEFDVLEYRNFSSYMLIVADFLNWSRKHEIIVGPGRGSVGGCLTAYLNNIHKAYPKKYNLIFARFLNKFKEAFPDIDLDFPPSKRHFVHDYLRKKYGENMVAHVSNVNTITPKVYARDISRVFEFGDLDKSHATEIGNNIADSIPAEIKSAKKALSDAPLFAEYAKVYPELEKYANLVSGQPRAWATHAGGIVIGKVPLEEIVPLRRDTQGNISTEYDKIKAEDNGLVKHDLLALSTLDIISLAREIIKDNGKEPPPIDFDFEQYDEKSYNLISSGDTFGMFQLGGTAVPVCKAVKPKCISDIALVSALIRPAAKDIINDLIKVRDGDKQMKLEHPSLKRAFEQTYGFGLFEESLLFLAQDVAGWDLHAADKLRKLTKEKGKNPEKVKKWREEFIEGASKNKGVGREVGENVWNNTVQQFGGYGFNKSHATLYSMISFQSAYYKAHFPIEFLVANLIHEVNSEAPDSKENIVRIKNEIRSQGIDIVPPDLNTSDYSYKIIDDKTLMTGLDSLKYMGKDAIPELIEKRPFKDFSDLIQRTDSLKVRSPSIQALAACGGLDSFQIDRELMFYYASDYRNKLRSHMNKLDRKWEKAVKEIAKEKKKIIKEIPPIPESFKQKHIDEFSYPFPKCKNWKIPQRFALEEYFMGEGISGTVFERYSGYFDNGSVNFSELPKKCPYKKVINDEKKNRYANRHDLWQMGINGLKTIVSHVFSFTVKKESSKIFGQEMGRVTLLDPWGNELQMVCFPEAWANANERINKLSKGKFKMEPGIALYLKGQFQWENELTYSFILGDIISYKAPPALPKEMKSQKVKMPRAKKRNLSKEEILNLSQEEFVNELEDILIDDGISSVEEDYKNSFEDGDFD
jgi:DNA polymerase-3 subunit alpha